MKVIGVTDSTKEYICIVRHVELEKFMNLYFNNLKSLKVGDEFDLGTGYDFAAKTATALKKTEEFIKANKEVVQTILQGISLAKLTAEASDEDN